MKPHPLITQLAEQREALGFTRREAAEVAGIARATIDAFETGRRTPTITTLEAYARSLGYVITLIYVSEKHCTACNTTKPVRCFTRNRTTRDGLSAWCSSCHAADRLRKSHKQEVAA